MVCINKYFLHLAFKRFEWSFLTCSSSCLFLMYRRPVPGSIKESFRACWVFIYWSSSLSNLRLIPNTRSAYMISVMYKTDPIANLGLPEIEDTAPYIDGAGR